MDSGQAFAYPGREMSLLHERDVERFPHPCTDASTTKPTSTAPVDLAFPPLAHHKPLDAIADEPSKSERSSVSTVAAAQNVTEEKMEHEAKTKKRDKAEPETKYPYHWMNIMRWEWLSTYRRLNLLVFITNITIIVAFAAQQQLLSLDPGAMSIAIATNIMIAVLFRQEYIINALFIIFGCCRPSWPLCIRRLSAKVYHFGGVHSGAGMVSVIWLAFFDMSLALSYQRTGMTPQAAAVITITAILNLLLCTIVASSLPKFRERYHNIWELIHRFGGWLAVAFYWVAFGLLAEEKRLRNEPDRTISQVLIQSPTFWMLLVITVSLVMPWLRLRKVPVDAEYESNFAIRLHFRYTNLPLCAAPRISTSPLREWHPFAGIPEVNGEGFSVLVSGVGDWTKKLIANPPTKIWVRGIPVRGVLHVAPIFKKTVLVATGSGIGPVLSLLVARAVDCRILWVTRDPSKSYQPDIIQQVLDADPRAQIMTRVKGQKDPNLGALAYDLVQESGAEAVFVISNKEGCYSARVWLASRGVPVFTPIFDS